MDSWLQRLVVRGQPSDVSTFRKAAKSSKRAMSLTVDGERTQVLSFERLRGALPKGQLTTRLEEPIEEPWDLVVDPPSRVDDGTVELTYKFQLSKYEPEVLIIAMSRQYPRLCFVLGLVAPSSDEQSSLLIHNGRSWAWRLPGHRKEIIAATIPEETDRQRH